MLKLPVHLGAIKTRGKADIKEFVFLNHLRKITWFDWLTNKPGKRFYITTWLSYYQQTHYQQHQQQCLANSANRRSLVRYLENTVVTRQTVHVSLWVWRGSTRQAHLSAWQTSVWVTVNKSAILKVYCS